MTVYLLFQFELIPFDVSKWSLLYDLYIIMVV